jgi:hypothetical protein
MDFLQQHLMISLEKEGPDKLIKQSFPLRFGRYSEIKTPDFEFCFNLNGEIRSIRGLQADWPHPAEQLKRTDGNDWVYYTVGDKSGGDGIISWMGEYYLPCLPYVSNPVWEINYFSSPVIMRALAAGGGELICFAAKEAYRSFGLRHRMDQTPFLYLFGSVGSFLGSNHALFEQLNGLPFYTYINLGFESIDPETLSRIGKPVTAQQVKEAFEKTMGINSAFERIEITGNFIAGDNLSPRHEASLADLLSHAGEKRISKGAIYLSPLKDSPRKRELLPRFYNIKEESKLPVLVYLIQRL